MTNKLLLPLPCFEAKTKISVNCCYVYLLLQVLPHSRCRISRQEKKVSGAATCTLPDATGAAAFPLHQEHVAAV